MILNGFTRDGNKPKYLDYVELTCRVLSGFGGDTKVCLHTGDGCWDRHPNPGPYNGWGLSFTVACTADQAATGLFGHSEISIDAVGLICGPKPQATVPVATNPPPPPLPPDMNEMLIAHNEKRKLHCDPQLIWSAQLAAAAQQYANQCILDKHGSSGENMADWVTIKNGQRVLPAATSREVFDNVWYCEVNNYNFNAPAIVGGFKTGCGPPVNGDFTQVVWKATRRLFSAAQKGNLLPIGGQKGTHWVCRYLPAGNNTQTLAQNVLRPTCH